LSPKCLDVWAQGSSLCLPAPASVVSLPPCTDPVDNRLLQDYPLPPKYRHVRTQEPSLCSLVLVTAALPPHCVGPVNSMWSQGFRLHTKCLGAWVRKASRFVLTARRKSNLCFAVPPTTAEILSNFRCLPDEAPNFRPRLHRPTLLMSGYAKLMSRIEPSTCAM